MAAYAELAGPAIVAAAIANHSPAYREALVALHGGAVRDLRIAPGV